MGSEVPLPVSANTREDAGKASCHAVDPLVVSVIQNCLNRESDLTNDTGEERD